MISRTAIDCYYFDETQVRFCESENVESFAEGIIEVLTDEDLRQRLVRNAFAYVARNHWGNKKQEYLDLVDGLIGGTNANGKPVQKAFTARTSRATVNDDALDSVQRNAARSNRNCESPRRDK